MAGISRFINEMTPFKILVDGNGVLLSLTTKKRAYFLFVSTMLVGLRVAPTTDPYPGIVEVCGYDIATIVRHWRKLANLKLPLPKNSYSNQEFLGIALRETSGSSSDC
ncbi:MAG: hypothetical protein JRN52_04825 [Nitrososphaerota archaeon]|nr:hypothetical protein [Nitrososphaerota archaeon]